MKNPVFYENQDGVLYALINGIYQPIPIAQNIIVNKGGGLGRSQVISLINQFGGGELLSFKVELTSDQIKTAFSMPILAVPSAGADKILRVMSFDYDFTANTTPYTSGQLLIRNQTSLNAQARTIPTVLSGGVDLFTTGALVGGSNNLIENQPLEIYANADSLVGDGTMIIYGTYIIITE